MSARDVPLTTADLRREILLTANVEQDIVSDLLNDVRPKRYRCPLCVIKGKDWRSDTFVTDFEDREHAGRQWREHMRMNHTPFPIIERVDDAS